MFQTTNQIRKPWEHGGFMGWDLPSGKDVQEIMENHHGFLGRLTTSMAIFNSYAKLQEGIEFDCPQNPGNTKTMLKHVKTLCAFTCTMYMIYIYIYTFVCTV